MPVKCPLAITLAALVAVAACAQPESAHDSHLTLNKAAPDTFRFTGPEELVAFFEEHQYTIETWRAGDRTIPRLYLASVPPRWRDDVAPNLTVELKKRYFFFVYAPLVLESNEDIMLDRARLLALESAPTRSADDEVWLLDLARRYFVVDDEDTRVDAEAMTKLRRRVDAVPPSLALAQAAVESGWSTSRFAVQGNALFGQWTWGADGITPQEQRGEMGDYKIRRFDSPEASIAAYMHNLNTHRSYRGFREERARLRAAGVPPGGSELAHTLTSYSEKGEDYTEMLLTVIRINQLPPADETRLRDMRPVLLLPVGPGS
jgi:uncharacterized FlgJ-related protein